MEHMRNLNDHALKEANEYPDLDYTPKYPWVGPVNGLDHLTNYASQDVYDDYPLQAVGIRKNEPWHGNEKDYGALGQLESLEDASQSSKSRWRRLSDTDDAFDDPDFELSEENSVSDGHFSEMLSESPCSSPQNRPNRLHKGNRGRGRSSYMVRGGRGGKGIKRGQRKPLEPSVEFKALHSQATMAFIDHDYEEAEQLALQAILMNPEMFPAHSLLSEIHMARGNRAKALAALFNGAHTRPRDTQVWSKVAQLILERAGEDKLSAIRAAIYCYNRAIAVDKTDVRARYKRAALNRDLGRVNKAASDYEYLLKQFPHETTVLRLLAEIYTDLEKINGALSYYDYSFSHYRLKEPRQVLSVTWSDINIYTELYGIQKQYDKGISQIKSLSRWLLGRGSDFFWDNIDVDDREWDGEDQPRRIQVSDYKPGQYKVNTYGDGLPLELRVKLGIYRLNLGDDNFEEAINHFEWLDPKDRGPGAKLFDYPDLFREVADALRGGEFFREALQFYEPLQQLSDYMDTSYVTGLASCYRAVGLSSEAMNCYETAMNSDKTRKDPQFQMAEQNEEPSTSDRASANGKGLVFDHALKSKQPGKVVVPKRLSMACASDSAPFSMIVPRLARRPIKDIVLEKSIREQTKAEDAHTLLLQMQKIKATAQSGDLGHKFQWMLSAKTLIQDFQSERLFFPFDKYVKFYGYSKEARKMALNTKAVQALHETKATSRQLRLSSEDSEDGSGSVPIEFRGIYFHVWLDIFLEYAVALARSGDRRQAYEVITSASNANVFYHSPDSMFLIQVCWFTCALIANDEEMLCNVARWFIKEYQFVTDGYRLFSALNRLCNTQNAWYNCGPTQKYVLRQLKAMDYSLVDHSRHKSQFQERASYTTKDDDGNWIQAGDLDIALLMLYGHILYVGRSYSYSINYFLRAFALDPTNPMINLSLALGYIHYAIKRQADNRHHFLMQGFAFLFTYHDIRLGSNTALEKQEADYNVARAYYMLGLTHLAIPYYQRCLDMDAEVRKMNLGLTAENFTRDAAFALQGLWATCGDVDKAREVTNKWLVI